MVNAALQTAVIAITGLFSGAGWFYFGKMNSTQLQNMNNDTNVATDNNLNYESGFVPEAFAVLTSIDSLTSEERLTHIYESSEVLEINTENNITEKDTIEKANEEKSKIKVVTIEDSIELVQSNRWIILVYADWCPNAQNYLPIWDKFSELVDGTTASHPSLPTFVTKITLKNHPRLSKLLNVDVLPFVICIEDGYTSVSIKQPSVRELLSISDIKWDLKKSERNKLPDHVSNIGTLGISLYDTLAQHIFTLQDKFSSFIHESKYIAYTIFAAFVAVIYMLKSKRYIEI